MFVSSWQTDEPILEVMEACRQMAGSVSVFISGKPKQRYEAMLEGRPGNFIPTGFLSDEAYFELMASVDAVIAISTRPGTLCCGAYEGVAMGKPIVVNNEQITKDYFSAGALYTDSTVDDIVRTFRHLANHREALAAEVTHFRAVSSEAWQVRLQSLDAEIARLRSPS